MNCQICGKEVKNLRCLSKHIRDIHKDISIKKYYDMFLMKKLNEGSCIMCNKLTKWRNIRDGYVMTCGHVCGCKYHRQMLKTDKNKLNSFINKVRENQTKIWKQRELSGEKKTIFEGVSTKNKLNNDMMSYEERCKKFGWLNKLTPDERSIKIKQILESSLLKFYNEASDEEKRKIIEKRIETRIRNGTMSDPALRTNFEKYSRIVRSKSMSSYRKYKDIIDSRNLRGFDFHLDHKISILYGFLNNISEDIISHYMNLEVIPSRDNLSKHSECSINIEHLLSLIQGKNE